MLQAIKEKAILASENENVKTAALCAAVAATLALGSGDVLAGAGGTEFDDIWTTVKDWLQGTLGRVIAGGIILIGIIAGMGRGSLMAFGSGIGGGMGLYYSPDIVESVLTATLEKAPAVTEAVVQISNGLQ